MRYACGLLLFLAGACGGGNGGTLPGNGTNASRELAQQVLEACGATFFGEVVELLTIVEGLLDPDETDPQPFAIDGLDEEGAAVTWSLDLDGDTVPELMGTLLFATEAGEPETAADVNLLADGFDDLDALIGTLPDDTRITFAATRPDPPITDVTQTFVVVGGAVDRASAIALTQNPECQVNVEFTDVAFQSLGGPYPSLTANLSVVTTDGALQGTVAFDGTGTARIEVVLGTEIETFAFTVDLETGVVTVAP